MAHRGLTMARSGLHLGDQDFRTAATELDFVAIVQRRVLDSLPVQPGPVATTGIDEQVPTVLVANLGMSPGRIEVDLGIEIQITVGHATDTDQVLFELELPSSVGAFGLAEADHDRPQSVGGVSWTSVGFPASISTSSPT